MLERVPWLGPHTHVIPPLGDDIGRQPDLPRFVRRDGAALPPRLFLDSKLQSMPPSVTTRAATPQDLDEIRQLHARVFGPGRFARTAYRVREGTPELSEFCRVAVLDQRIIAALRLTAVRIAAQSQALLLGPLAVDAEFKGQGYGRQLVAEALDAARIGGIAIVVLVGDEPYYGKFGFERVPPGSIVLPGPVDPARLLVAELVPGALAGARGVVVAA